MQDLIEIILHTDDALLDLIERYGDITYLILFLIIYSETGLVIFPFLPGDGLLLSVGVIASTGVLNIWILIPLLILAAILGNSSNYLIGRFSQKYLTRIRNRTFHHYLEGSRQFYIKHGPIAIVVCRFFPIVRTYAPFVAGVASMDYKVFTLYNIGGAILWVCLFTFLGYTIGEIPWVKANYGLIFLGLILITMVPFLFHLIKTVLRRRSAGISSRML